MIAAVEMIKKTPLSAQRLVIVTIRRADQYTLRPYTTCALDDAGNVVASADFATVAAALLRHDELVKKMERRTAPVLGERINPKGDRT